MQYGDDWAFKKAKSNIADIPGFIVKMPDCVYVSWKYASCDLVTRALVSTFVALSAFSSSTAIRATFIVPSVFFLTWYCFLLLETLV